MLNYYTIQICLSVYFFCKFYFHPHPYFSWNFIKLISGRTIVGESWDLPRISSKVGGTQCFGEGSVQETKTTTPTTATCSYDCISSCYARWFSAGDTTENSIKVAKTLFRTEAEPIDNGSLYNRCLHMTLKIILSDGLAVDYLTEYIFPYIPSMSRMAWAPLYLGKITTVLMWRQLVTFI
jgi:hypothetical protein